MSRLGRLFGSYFPVAGFQWEILESLVGKSGNKLTNNAFKLLVYKQKLPNHLQLRTTVKYKY
jgi:hypothetical protein